MFLVYGCQLRKFTQQPVSMNYNKGEEFMFTCSATNVDFLNFLVNEASVNTDDGFTVTPTTNGNVSTNSLTGTAQIQHNETIISCVGIVSMPLTQIFSNTAVLLVQGSLSSVVGLSSYSINSSTVNITWSPPFTLPGTNIIGYNISVATITSTVEAFTSNNYIEITVSTCIETNITVTGYNGLDGESSTIPLDINVSPIPVTVSTLMEENKMVTIKLNVNISNQCPQHIPTLVNITTQYSNGTTVDDYNNIPLEQVSTDNILTTAENITLAADQYYNATIVYSNTEGIINTTTNIDYNTVTFSIQSITLIDTIGPVIVVVCTFRPNAVAVGCLIQLILLTDNTVQYTNTSNRTGDQAIIILSGVTTGSYQLRVFEVESDQSLVPVSHLEEELTIIESATITTLIMSSTITTSLTDSSNTITSTSSISVNASINTAVYPDPSSQTDNANISIGISVGVPITVLLVLIVIGCSVIIIITILLYYRRERRKNINVELNPAYEDPRSFLQENNNPEPRNTVTTTNNNIIDIRQNPSYSLVEMSENTRI